MADTPTLGAPPAAPPKGRFDPLVMLAGIFLALAFALAAVPAFKAGPDKLAGLLLLMGLGAVAVLVLVAFRGGRDVAVEDEDGVDLVIQALGEPAAVVGADGRLQGGNAAWVEATGDLKRLPRHGPAASSLFQALQSARRGQTGQASLKALGRDHAASVAPLGEGRYLIRLADSAAEPLRLTGEAPAALQTAPLRVVPTGPAVLDAYAAASPFGAALLDGEEVFSARIVEANPALAGMVGGSAVVGQTFGDLISRASHIDAALGVSEGRAGPFEVRLAHDPTRVAHLYLARTDGRLVAFLVDVTAQKQIELQLAQAQKMQAIGQLAGGVAHDFNNLLTAIQVLLDELLQRHPLGDPSYEGLNEIRQTATRAADLVRKLLTFSRKSTVQREVLDLGELITGFEVLLRRLLREDVKMVTDYGRDLPTVRVDKGQIETAVMNLAVNARDAMRDAKVGGTVKIRTARLTYAEAKDLGYAGLAMGDMALIEVSDDGPGIAPNVVGKIFEPFFTTKAVGEGTGLGLATVWGIVKQSDGWIHVQSEVAPNEGHGAAFRIFLPVHVRSANDAPAPAATPLRPAARDLSGVGRILFVEDEPTVRKVAARLLRARGYDVIEACDGEAALLLAEEYAGKIDLMISDVIMPGIDGPTLLKKARGYLGEAPVMFISGYAEAEFSDLLEGETGVTFLPKPLDIKMLAERVKEQLAA
ncbi:cell cycle histidine kinase CckA [Caulobacter ginsengisoli]|nr:response regulator [Caulobacter ginsengisoli]